MKNGKIESSPPDDQLDNRQSQMELQVLGTRFATGLGLLLIAYLVGYLRFSFAWLILGLIVWILRFKYLKEQKAITTIHRSIAEDEKTTISAAMKYLPSWVYFPDMERAEWINKILKQMWPFVDEYVKKLMKESIEPSVVSSLPDYLKSFRFEKMDLGSVPIRVGSVKCYDANTSRKEIILDLEILYAGNCEIVLKVKGMSFGIKDIQLYGTMRVEMRPLLKDMPLVGGLSFYFLTNPAVEFNLTNLADVLDFPGLSDVLRRAISEQLAAYVVLPNKYVFPLTDVAMKSLKFAPPAGVVRLEVVEGKHLKKSDIGLLGLGKSDPYCNVTVAAQEFKTHVISNTTNPKWNFACEAVVHHTQGQSLTIEVMDEDQGSKDDFLGRTSVSFDLIASQGYLDDWFTLEDTESGSLHIRTTWLTLSTDPDCLDKQLEAAKSWQAVKCKNGDDSIPCGSVAAVFIYLDSAKNLPTLIKGSAEPSASVVFSIGNEQRRSSVKPDASDPVWEECFYFLIGDPRHEHELRAEVIDSKCNKPIGLVTLSLVDLFKAEEMSLEQSFRIRGKCRECTLLMTLKMRLLRDLTKVSGAADKAKPQLPPQASTDSYVPSLEEVVYSTVEPILDTAGEDRAILDEKQVELRSRSHENNLSRSSMVAKYPRIQMTLSKSPGNRITLIIHKIENLPFDESNKPDTYVKLIPISDRREPRFKTDVKRNSLDPEFEEMFELGIKDSLPQRFEVCVYDKGGSGFSGMFVKSKELGRTVVDLSDIDHSDLITQWYDLEMKTD